MAVYRVHATRDYTVMSNTHLRDKNMSLKTKGLLSVMLSLPPNWNYSLKGLCAICKESEGAVNSALHELKQLGYLVVTKLNPNETDSGRYEYIYDIYENPKQGGKKQGVEFQGVENRGLYKSTKKLNIKELNTNECSSDGDENKLNIIDKKNGVVMLSDKQMEDLLERLTLDEFNTYIDKLGDFIVEKGANVKNHYKTILKWVEEDRKK